MSPGYLCVWYCAKCSGILQAGGRAHRDVPRSRGAHGIVSEDQGYATT